MSGFPRSPFEISFGITSGLLRKSRQKKSVGISRKIHAEFRRKSYRDSNEAQIGNDMTIKKAFKIASNYLIQVASIQGPEVIRGPVRSSPANIAKAI